MLKLLYKKLILFYVDFLDSSLSGFFGRHG